MAIVATDHYIRRGEFGETLRLARALRRDSHDLIHQAAGWMPSPPWLRRRYLDA